LRAGDPHSGRLKRSVCHWRTLQSLKGANSSRKSCGTGTTSTMSSFWRGIVDALKNPLRAEVEKRYSPIFVEALRLYSTKTFGLLGRSNYKIAQNNGYEQRQGRPPLDTLVVV
jgi:hypothetical protein